MSENVSAIKYGTNYGGLERAKEIARELKRKLQDNDFHAIPMLEVHPRANCYENFTSLISSPYVISRDIPTETGSHISFGLLFYTSTIAKTHHYPDNPNNYLKPLDIVKVKCRDQMPNTNLSLTGREYFYHVGVYLGRIEGEYKVCHFPKSINGTRVQS